MVFFFSSINSLTSHYHVPCPGMSRLGVGFCEHKNLYNAKAGLRIHLCPCVALTWGKNRSSVERSPGVFSLSESPLWILHQSQFLIKLLLSECRSHLFKIACLIHKQLGHFGGSSCLLSTCLLGCISGSYT